jgi:ATP-dependent NAD(P)H-hydrate dehydratase
VFYFTFNRLLINRMVQEVTSSLDRLHVLVIGPGLGRCPMVLEATFRIIQEAKSRNVPLVLDADALFLLTLDPYQKALENYDKVVLTPNVVEGKRLNGLEQYWKGATVVQKGAQDVICRDEQILLTCAEEGGWKRSGGLGDILAGTIGTLMAWNSILTDQGKASSSDLPLACWTACCVAKRATKRAYESHLRAMTAPDVLTDLGPTINEMTSPSSKL